MFVCGSSLSKGRRGALTVKPSRIRGRSEMAPRQGDSGFVHDADTLAHATSGVSRAKQFLLARY